MLVSKPKYYLFLLVFLLLPFSVQAAWSEPVQAPPGGNAALPVYTTGTNQTIDGTLHVGTPGSYATGLQGSGSTNGIQGNSAANALFGNLAVSGAGGNRGVYGLAVDTGDYALYSGGGLGLGFASGDIWFLQRDAGIAWPRVSDGQALYGVYVTSGGELQVRGHGGGINFMNQTPTSLMTISEAGAANVANSLTVGGTPVCLQNGTGCPAVTTPNLQQVTTAGNTTTNQIRLTPSPNIEALRVISSNYSPLVIRNTADSADLFRVDQAGNTSAGGSLTVSGVTAANAGISVDGQTVIDDGAGWHRSYGATGWYNGTYGGGWYMSDATWIRSYGSKNVYSDQGIRAERGLAGGSYNPDSTKLVTTPTFYTEQGQVGNATGGLKGAGTFNSVQLCIQGDCRAAWPAASPTPTLQAVTTAGNTTSDSLNLQGALSNSLGDLVINDWVDVQWGLKNSTANNGGNLFINDGLHANYDFTVKGNAAFGNYAIDAAKAVTTPTLYSEQAQIGGATGGLKGAGTLNSVQLCIQGDCKASWSAVATSAGWADNGDNVYLTDSANFVGIGVTPAPPFVKLRVYPQNLVEGVRIKSSDYSPFIVRNQADSQDLFRINESGNISSYADMNINSTNGSLRLNDNTYVSGNLNVAGIDNRIGGARRTVPLAVKTDTQGNGIVIECGMASCSNTLEFRVTNQNYSVIDTYYTPAATNLAINPSPFPGYNGGYVGIGTTSPNKQLHIKTAVGNAELDIQSVGSPYWGIYQDDGTDDLRFWNTDNRLILKTNGLVNIPGSLSFGSVDPNSSISSASSEGEDDVLIIKNALGQSVAEFGADLIMTNRRATIFRDWVYFTSDSGPTVIAASGNLTATGNVQGSQMCISGNCKTGWGANSGQRVYVNTSTPGDNVDYVCPAGYVMTGIKNSSPGQLICDRMW